MKTILVPTDYSQEGHNALLWAMEIAQIAKAQIVLFHAFYQPVSYPYDKDYSAVVNELERQHNEKLEAYLSQTRLSLRNSISISFKSRVEAGALEGSKSQLSKSGFHTIETDNASARKAEVQIRCVCKLGFAFDQILKAIDVHRVDLVVMGMKGIGALHMALLGRTTLHVMRDANVPVLAVPLHARFQGFKSIVFAADLFSLPSTAVLEALRQVVKLFNSHLQVLHLYHGNSLVIEKKKALAALDTLDRALYDLSFEVVFEQQEAVAEGVRGFVQEQQADLLVLIPQKHPFLERLLDTSVTRKMLTNPITPLLALPPDIHDKWGAAHNEGIGKTAASKERIPDALYAYHENITHSHRLF